MTIRPGTMHGMTMAAQVDFALAYVF